MMESMRPPLMLSAGDALTEALDYLRNEWRPAHIPLGNGGNGSRRDRSRTPPRRGGKGGGKNNSDDNAVKTVSCLRGGKSLCAAFNVGKCLKDERRCPKKHIHRCNYRKSNGEACGDKHARVDNHQ